MAHNIRIYETLKKYGRIKSNYQTNGKRNND